jgi:transposase, IS30 family
MSHYTHLTIFERENILLLSDRGLSIRAVASELNRSPSTISRELKRNVTKKGYSPTISQNKYKKRRRKCGRKLLLSCQELWNKVRHLFVSNQWSPEQISQRLKYENSKFCISYTTIYRAIYSGRLETEILPHGKRGLVRSLRHKGKTRHTKQHIEKRGKIPISYTIHERPEEANSRLEVGHWEADTVAGKTGGACLVTLTDRKSRYLLAGKINKKVAVFVRDEMIRLFESIGLDKVKSITPDRGKEFSKHSEISLALNDVPFYFPDPRSPWQRGTNENTNGLIREYLPKYKSMDDQGQDVILDYVSRLNSRPKKCLGWKTPYEVFFNKVLRLI